MLHMFSDVAYGRKAASRERLLGISMKIEQ